MIVAVPTVPLMVLWGKCLLLKLRLTPAGDADIVSSKASILLPELAAESGGRGMRGVMPGNVDARGPSLLKGESASRVVEKLFCLSGVGESKRMLTWAADRSAAAECASLPAACIEKLLNSSSSFSASSGASSVTKGDPNCEPIRGDAIESRRDVRAVMYSSASVWSMLLLLTSTLR